MKNLDKKTSNLIHKYIEEFQQRTHGTVLYLTVSGSKLYGTDNENSDLDIKGIFVPSKRSVLLKKDLVHYTRDSNTSKEKNSKDDIDFTLHSVHQFFNLLAKSETGSVDILFSMFNKDNIIYENEEFTSIIKENYKYFLNKNMKSFIGYSLSQAKRFGIKGARYDELTNFVNYLKELKYNKEDKLSLYFNKFEREILDKKYNYIKFVNAPSNRNKAEEAIYISVLGKLFLGTVTIEYFINKIETLFNQFGNRTKTIAKTGDKTDWKALSHSYRIANEVKELLETNFIKFPLTDASHIKDIKKGNIDTQIVINEIYDILENVDTLLLKSELPEEVDEELINVIIIRILDEFAL